MAAGTTGFDESGRVPPHTKEIGDDRGSGAGRQQKLGRRDEKKLRKKEKRKKRTHTHTHIFDTDNI